MKWPERERDFLAVSHSLVGLKLEKDFYNAQKNKFNISKVPDIYDSIKYDLLHNKKILQFPNDEDLYVCSKALADLVVPQVTNNSPSIHTDLYRIF